MYISSCMERKGLIRNISVLMPIKDSPWSDKPIFLARGFSASLGGSGDVVEKITFTVVKKIEPKHVETPYGSVTKTLEKVVPGKFSTSQEAVANLTSENQ
jgi:hypothetical protein